MIKKNGQKVVSSGGSRTHARRTFVIYSEGWLKWENCSFLYISEAKKKFSNLPLQGPIEIHFEFHLKNRQGEPDVSNLVEGPQDTLKKYGVIVDDKFVYQLHAKKIFGGEPKTIITIYPYLGNCEIKGPVAD